MISVETHHAGVRRVSSATSTSRASPTRCSPRSKRRSSATRCWFFTTSRSPSSSSSRSRRASVRSKSRCSLSSPRRAASAASRPVSRTSPTSTSTAACSTENDNRRFINLANQLWHTDSSFKRTPGKMSMLSAQEVVPDGGETEFADMRAAWDALPDGRKREIDRAHRRARLLSLAREGRARSGVDHARASRVAPCRAAGAGAHSPGERPQVAVPRVAHHAHLSAWTSGAKPGSWSTELIAHATQPRVRLHAPLAVNDVVMWDNRCTMHRGRPHDESQRRAMRRATVSDSGPDRARELDSADAADERVACHVTTDLILHSNCIGVRKPCRPRAELPCQTRPLHRSLPGRRIARPHRASHHRAIQQDVGTAGARGQPLGRRRDGGRGSRRQSAGGRLHPVPVQHRVERDR